MNKNYNIRVYEHNVKQTVVHDNSATGLQEREITLQGRVTIDLPNGEELQLLVTNVNGNTEVQVMASNNIRKMVLAPAASNMFHIRYME